MNKHYADPSLLRPLFYIAGIKLLPYLLNKLLSRRQQSPCPHPLKRSLKQRSIHKDIPYSPVQYSTSRFNVGTLDTTPDTVAATTRRKTRDTQPDRRPGWRTCNPGERENGDADQHPKGQHPPGNIFLTLITGPPGENLWPENGNNKFSNIRCVQYKPTITAAVAFYPPAAARATLSLLCLYPASKLFRLACLPRSIPLVLWGGV